MEKRCRQEFQFVLHHRETLFVINVRKGYKRLCLHGGSCRFSTEGKIMLTTFRTTDGSAAALSGLKSVAVACRCSWVSNFWKTEQRDLGILRGSPEDDPGVLSVIWLADKAYLNINKQNARLWVSQNSCLIVTNSTSRESHSRRVLLSTVIFIFSRWYSYFWYLPQWICSFPDRIWNFQ